MYQKSTLFPAFSKLILYFLSTFTGFYNAKNLAKVTFLCYTNKNLFVFFQVSCLYHLAWEYHTQRVSYFPYFQFRHIITFIALQGNNLVLLPCELYVNPVNHIQNLYWVKYNVKFMLYIYLT